MAIYPVQSNYIIDVDIITTTSFKAGMVLMRDDNGRAIPADNTVLLYRTIQQKAGKHLGFAASDHDVSGVTIVEPDVISASWLDNNKNFQRYENAEILHSRRFIPEHFDLPYDITSPTNRSTLGKRGIGVYNQPNEQYITDQFVPVLHGDFGLDNTQVQTINPGDLLTVGSGINAGKMVKVNVNSIGTDIIVVGVVDKYDTNSGLLYFTNAFYSITFSSSSAILALDAGNTSSFPNTGIIGTVCGITLNEGSGMTLTAPAGHVFDKVLFASYGTPNGVCGNFSIGACHAATSQTAAEGLLLGNNSVFIVQSNFLGLVGDPCMGTLKRLYIQARFAPTLAKDLTVNNNNGTLTNGVTYDTAGGGSWSFDGTNDYISFARSSIYDLTGNDFVVMFWFYSTNTSIYNVIIDLNDAGGKIIIATNITTGTLRMYYSSPVLRIGTINICNGVWHSIVITRKNNTLVQYVDGVVSDSVDVTGVVLTTNNFLSIGKLWQTNEYGNMKLTDIRLYKGIGFTQAQAVSYYNATKSRYGL